MSISSPARRQFLGRAALAAIPAFLRPHTALGAVGLNTEQRAPDHVLVTIFLRGGADGLSLVIPHADDHYHRSRPTLGLAAPVKGSGAGVADLDGYFGLHPALRPLLPSTNRGRWRLSTLAAPGIRRVRTLRRWRRWSAGFTARRGRRADGSRGIWRRRRGETRRRCAPWRWGR